MDPEVFIEQEDVRPLIKALNTFASQIIEANARQNQLGNAEVDSNFLSKLTFNTSPIQFANTLVANFRRYSPSKARPDYHPMVKLLEYYVDFRDIYGFDDQDVFLFGKLIKQGKINLKALAARRTVGRIESPQGTGIGTGVYVGQNLLLTCYHVVKGLRQPVWVRFGYTTKSYGIMRPVELALNFVSKDNQLDYALVRLQTPPPNQPFARPSNVALSAGQEVRMIHHPQGRPVLISEGGIAQSGKDYIDHTIISAQEGSSGAPLFDEEWRVVALHRGVPSRGRTVKPNTLTALPIDAIWQAICSHLP